MKGNIPVLLKFMMDDAIPAILEKASNMGR
jgi:hypothetical protein